MKKIRAVISLSFLFVFLFMSCSGFLEQRKLEDIKADNRLQEKCRKKSEEYFQKEYGNGILNNGKRTVTYQNHYNRKLKKCLIILTTNYYSKNINKGYKEKHLFDVNYKLDYGFFHDSGTISFCDVQRKKCSSEEEWISLAQPYMED